MIGTTEKFIVNLLKLHFMASNSSKAVVSFIVGAAVGVAVGYFLNSDKKDELVDKLKFQADKLKDKFKKRKEQYEDALENELA
jgi:Tfp pilus assembly protein PilO